MITTARDSWYESSTCTIKSLIDYIIDKGELRDAQIEAIKTYLFLKIECNNKPLSVLFKSGKFNSINLSEIEVSNTVREYLLTHSDAAALFEYACLRNDEGKQVSEKIEKQIKESPKSINYSNFFDDAFYNVSYTDYLFSLPMGAGKTYLMAAFIYLDLYFAYNEPQNSAFAHNFIIFAPSGLKSSVVPSLKTIQKFNPSWVIPEPAATEIKRMIAFEVLDVSKSENDSNKTKNPNVQKIASHQPFTNLFGLVAVTNAEKVILDRIKKKNGQIYLIEESEDEKDRYANELRNLIGKLPSLSVFIDEVHHAVSSEIKLRAVVSKWTQNSTVNSVIGFSGTPYLDNAEKIKVLNKLSVKTAEITNIVYYYPLIDGVGNFLKHPILKIAEITDSTRIIEKGVREFLDTYKDTVYANELVAKLGIYCGTIEKLEQIVYPLVSRIVTEYGLSSDVILKFHRGNSKYPAPADSQMQFDILDKAISKIRIILLAQIGKEGWDCRSLTGIILSQEGDCNKNMVLQTACRCLRQVVKEQYETALIYLNKFNADKLNEELCKQHHITLKEFSSADNYKTPLKRYDRTEYLKLPKIDFYQLKINYNQFTIEEANPRSGIEDSIKLAQVVDSVIKTTDLSMDESKTSISVDRSEYGNVPTTFNSYMYSIMKDGFGTPDMAQLSVYSDLLKDVFFRITYEKDGIRYYSSKFNHKLVEANIRKAFYDKIDFRSFEELIPEKASLLNITNFTPEVYTDQPDNYYPTQDIVDRIIKDDKGVFSVDDDKMKQLVKLAEETGQIDIVKNLYVKITSHKNKDRSFHYLPYRTDSIFEQTFLKEILSFDVIEKLGIEIYYNGDRAMTEFKIKCYKRKDSKWYYIGLYTPDFLIIKRKDGKIHKAIIVETKGGIYANDPIFKDKRSFMENEFAKQNNIAFGYERFDYLYLEDTLQNKERMLITYNKIHDFFKEETQHAY